MIILHPNILLFFPRTSLLPQWPIFKKWEKDTVISKWSFCRRIELHFSGHTSLTLFNWEQQKQIHWKIYSTQRFTDIFCHSEILGWFMYFEQSSGNFKSVWNLYCLQICDISCSLIFYCENAFENLLVSVRKAILIQEDFNQPLNYPWIPLKFPLEKAHLSWKWLN